MGRERHFQFLERLPHVLAVFDAPPGGVSFRFGLVLNAVSSSAEDPAFQTMPVKVMRHNTYNTTLNGNVALTLPTNIL